MIRTAQAEEAESALPISAQLNETLLPPSHLPPLSSSVNDGLLSVDARARSSPARASSLAVALGRHGRPPRPRVHLRLLPVRPRDGQASLQTLPGNSLRQASRQEMDTRGEARGGLSVWTRGRDVRPLGSDVPAGELKASCSSALNHFLSTDHLDPSFCQRVYGLYSYKNQGWGTPKDDFERQVDEVRFSAPSSTRRFLVPPRAHSTTSYQDCLQVNIWTPVGPPPKDGWPVLFYIREFLQSSAIVKADWLTRLVLSSPSHLSHRWRVAPSRRQQPRTPVGSQQAALGGRSPSQSFLSLTLS